jgi:hypothetical protein
VRETLADDAIVVTDGGGKVRAASQPIQGADDVARFVSTLLTRWPGTVLTTESVNGRTGLVLRRTGHAVAVVGFSISDPHITAVWIVLNPDKLTRWHSEGRWQGGQPELLDGDGAVVGEEFDPVVARLGEDLVGDDGLTDPAENFDGSDVDEEPDDHRPVV